MVLMDVILDSLMDVIKIIPFLFVIYLKELQKILQSWELLEIL